MQTYFGRHLTTQTASLEVNASDKELLQGGSFMTNGPLLEETLTSTHPMLTFLTLACTQVDGFFFATKPLSVRQQIL